MGQGEVSYFRIGLLGASIVIAWIIIAAVLRDQLGIFRHATVLGCAFIATIVAFELYLDVRARTAGAIEVPRSTDDPRYSVPSLVLFGAVLAPAIMAAAYKLGYASNVIPMPASDLVIGAAGLLLLGCLLWPVVIGAKRHEPIPSMAFVALSVGSFTIWLGGPSNYRFFEPLMALQLINGIMFTRHSAIALVATVVFTVFLAEFIRRGIIERFDYKEVREEWRSQRANIAAIDYEELPVAGVVRAAVELSRFFFSAMGRYALVTARVVKSAFIDSVLAIVNVRRGGLALVLIILIAVGVYITAHSYEIIEILSTLAETESLDLRLMTLSSLVLVWFAVFIIAHARLCFENSRGVAVQMFPLIYAVVAAIWCVAVAMHISHAVGIIDSPALSLDPSDIFVLLFPIVSAAFAGIIGERARLPILGLSIAGFSLWAASAVFAHRDATTASWPALRPLPPPDPLTPRQVRTPQTNPQADRPTLKSREAVHIGVPEWMIGSWGVDGSCQSPITVEEATEGLSVTFAGEKSFDRFVEVSPDVVRTTNWIFRRAGSRVYASFNGEGIGELAPC